MLLEVGVAKLLDLAREDLRVSEARYAEKSRLLELTLENMNQGIMMVDRLRDVQVCNRRASELLDLPAAMMAIRGSAKVWCQSWCCCSKASRRIGVAVAMDRNCATACAMGAAAL